MPFAYYKRLSPTRKATYRRSDSITNLPLPVAQRAQSLIPPLSTALDEEDPRFVQQACQDIADEMLRQLQAPPVQVIILEVRPSDTYGESHGLYEPADSAYLCRITLWMRTAQRERVVAFRTFLRTLLHELLHHLDYEHFDLEETFHTAGFYQRESSLFHQLMPAVEGAGSPNSTQATTPHS